MMLCITWLFILTLILLKVIDVNGFFQRVGVRTNVVKVSMDQKFVQAGSNLAPISFGPRGIIIGGWTCSDMLSSLDFCLDSLHIDSEAIPVIILGEKDHGLPVKELLDDRFGRDRLPPVRAMKLDRPFILFSGLSMQNVKAISVDLVNTYGLPRPSVAIAVPRAIDKPIDVLAKEVIQDWVDNEAETS
jgi:hypothetical protein